MSMDMNEFRTIGHRMVDWIAEYLENVEDRALFPVVSPPSLLSLLPPLFLPLTETTSEKKKKSKSVF